MRKRGLGLKKTLVVLIILTMIMSAIPMAAVTMPGLDGEGTEADPYRINDASDLADMGSLINSDFTSYGDKHYVLTQNITLSEPEEGFYKNYDSIDAFAGTFDGQGYKIDGLVSNRSLVPTSIMPEGISLVSVFGFLSSGSEVKNLNFSNVDLDDYDVSVIANSVEAGARLENISISGSLNGSYSSGLVRNNYGEIINCHNSAAITGDTSAGGVALYNFGSIINCGNVGEVIAPKSVGGITASNFGTISQSVNSGDISGLNNTGGITGEMASIRDLKSMDLNTYNFEASYVIPDVTSVISGCRNTGEISNSEFMISDFMTTAIDYGYTSYLGGLVGSAEGTLSINNSINQGSVTGSSYNDQRTGGLVGSAYSLNIENCGNEGDVAAIFYSPAGGLVGFTANLSAVNSYNTGNLISNGSPADMKSFELEPNGVSIALMGGLAGIVFEQNVDLSLLIKNSYSSGEYIVTESEIKASSYESPAAFGNLAGTVIIIDDPDYESVVSIENSYWLDQGISDGPVASEEVMFLRSPDPAGDTNGSLGTFADNKGDLTPQDGDEIIDGQTDLLSALNTWVIQEKAASGTDYLFWGTLAAVNDGYPYFAPEITVTLDANGGQAGLTEKSGRPGLLYGQNSAGQAELLPAAARSGYTFGGWYEGKTESSTKITNQTVIANREDHTLYAYWNPFVYISKDSDTGITASGLEQNIRIPDSDLAGSSEIMIYIKVNEIDANSGKLNDAAKASLAEKGHLLLNLYDISIFKRITDSDGTYRDLAVPAADILGNITIRIPVSADQADKQNLAVAYLDDESIITYPETTRLAIDGIEYLQFVTNHFSNYAMIEMDAVPLVDLNPDEMTKTGEQPSAVLPALMIVGLGALLLLKFNIKSKSKG